MTDYNDDYDDYDDELDPDFGDSEPDQSEPSISEEMLFSLIKQAKEQQANANALIERLSGLADTLQAQEQGREKRINTAIDDLKNLDLQGIVSDTTKKAVGELVNTELAKGVSQFITVQNAKLEQNSREVGKANNILVGNINSFTEVIEQLKKDESDLLQNHLAKQVQQGVMQGVENGLKNVSNNLSGYVEKASISVQNTVSKLNAVEERVGNAIELLEDYNERLSNRKHWYLVIGWCVFYTIATTIGHIVVYRMNVPLESEIKERNQTIQQQDIKISQQQQQINYMQQALTTSLYTWKEGNLYYRVDRNKCTDVNNQNYCMKQ